MDRTARTALVISCLAYIALGCFGAAIGPLLPQMAQQTGSALAAVGAIFTALSTGGLVAQLLAGPLSDRLSPRPVMLTGLVLLALGVVGISISQNLLALLGCALIAGFGQGAADIGGSLLVAVTFARRNVAAMNLLHLFFGLGATLGPAAVSLSLTFWASGLAALWPAVILPLLLLPSTFRLRLSAHAGRVSVASPAMAIYRSPMLWAFAGLLGVYVGIEVGIGGWTTSYLVQTTGMALEMAALATSGYWLMLSGGRLVSTLLGTRLSAYAILGLSLAGTALASLGLLVGIGNQELTVIATLLMGLSFGPIYPTVMALVTATFKSGPGRAASVITASANLATMLIPWLQGLLLAGLGPASSPWFATLCCVIMVVFLMAARKLDRERQAQKG